MHIPEGGWLHSLWFEIALCGLANFGLSLLGWSLVPIESREKLLQALRELKVR